ncbi:MAG: M23 family metallopeptidase [Gammaproteobacteria bacterium]|nr:M23 family metallopeptidase [Gammaproteobacteria bacterium]
MNIIWISSAGGSRHLGRRELALLLILPLAIVAGVALMAGVVIGQQSLTAEVVVKKSALTGVVSRSLTQQRQEIDRLRDESEAQLLQLAVTTGELQSRVARLDAVGERLVELGRLDSDAFGFGATPALGGAEASAAEEEPLHLPTFLEQLDELAAEVRWREAHYPDIELTLETLMAEGATTPQGRPVEDGWISSRYGRRTDPFSGKQELHHGIDIAGKRGSKILSTAAGVVTWAGKQSGYGRLVEINHGNGIITRYGHNRDIVVKEGARVERGTVIAHMGSSGRSTGPHLHYEVIVDDQRVNPMQYLATAALKPPSSQ